MDLDRSFTCPRRAESYGVAAQTEDADVWWPDSARPVSEEPSCSYCGSLHPGRFMALVGEGMVVGPTTKSYKAYLHRPHDDAGEGPVIGKFYFAHLSRKQRLEFVELFNRRAVKIGYPGHFEPLPFFMKVVSGD